jgi:hypothetical protein
MIYQGSLAPNLEEGGADIGRRKLRVQYKAALVKATPATLAAVR